MSVTLGDLLQWGRDTLKQAGIADSNISAEALLQSLLDIRRAELLLNPQRQIDNQTHQKYRELIRQRAAHTPLQYLVGEVEFYNIKLYIDKRALIPRPETEILVETIMARLANMPDPSILDIGAGSGNIAIALAKNIPGSKVAGVDISPEALELARSNAVLNEVNVTFLAGDILDKVFVNTLGHFDCVVSNPPYVSLDQKEQLQPEVIEFEPAIALFSGPDPLIFFRAIIENVSYILKRGGLLGFEIGMGQSDKITKLMQPDFRQVEIVRDLAGIERVVTGIYAGSNE